MLTIKEVRQEGHDEELFWQDPYMTKLETKVSQVCGNQIQLAETIFFAMSGGQESDQGTIADFPILEVEKRDKDIVYFLASDHSLGRGDQVVVEIDWPRRHRLMRLHFAAEIILELVYARLGAVRKIDAHISAEKARIDFAWQENLAPLFQNFELAAKGIIERNEKIESA